jgi:branched-chain amino acid transport system ATP-binding protein
VASSPTIHHSGVQQLYQLRVQHRHFGTYSHLAEQGRIERARVGHDGQMSNLKTCRGLMSQPKMMLLDEPSAALAPQVVLDIFRTIGRVCREGMTLLLVEQNVRMALLLAEYAYVLRDGIVHLEGPAESLISDHNVRLSYLGGAAAAAATQD